MLTRQCFAERTRARSCSQSIAVPSCQLEAPQVVGSDLVRLCRVGRSGRVVLSSCFSFLPYRYYHWHRSVRGKRIVKTFTENSFNVFTYCFHTMRMQNGARGVEVDLNDNPLGPNGVAPLLAAIKVALFVLFAFVRVVCSIVVIRSVRLFLCRVWFVFRTRSLKTLLVGAFSLSTIAEIESHCVVESAADEARRRRHAGFPRGPTSMMMMMMMMMMTMMMSDEF